MGEETIKGRIGRKLVEERNWRKRERENWRKKEEIIRGRKDSISPTSFL